MEKLESLASISKMVTAQAAIIADAIRSKPPSTLVSLETVLDACLEIQAIWDKGEEPTTEQQQEEDKLTAKVKAWIQVAVREHKAKGGM